MIGEFQDMPQKALVQIQCESDIITARKTGRIFSNHLHFNSINQARIITTVSELARNIYRYAGTGQMSFEPIEEAIKTGLKITAIDQGPGIIDISNALKHGYSSSGGLGAGLPGVKNMMDDFYIESSPGNGTRVTVVKWQ
ncbi:MULTISPECIES: anti-sigma regulatory factor [unclassified Mesobacillus]|uniref:anti-sigma regulatory factor n=1 Tax=unclassified Mesobacillus TaxID=2675270 RepID=UPI00255A3077|nr:MULTISPECIES: anti-sigma regulatory factor [unclassified Mesobacillus]